MNEMALKWAQLDLARQMESVEFIQDFIVMLESCGYNGLLLYCEDRISTASYRLAAAHECYTEAEIRGLVRFGKLHGIELVPCVATLGHAERFLRHAELRKFAELGEGMTGRFGNKKPQTFCITHPEFYDFIGTYLTEVAALFDSGYFHVGLDEFWDYNLCARCREAMPTLELEQRYFIEHIRKIHAVLARCGKRIMMWSDMFEYYPEAFDAVPSDVIMVDWQYGPDVRDYLGHLLDLGREDRFAANRAHGFETIIAPAEKCFSNPVSYIEYALRSGGVKGCLLTSWENTDTFMYRRLPFFALTGYLLNGHDVDAAWALVMKNLYGTADVTLAAALRLALNIGLWRHFESVSEAKLLSRNFFGINHAACESDAAAYAIIAENRDKITTEWGRRSAQDLLYAFEEKLISHRLHKCVQIIMDDGYTPERGAEFDRGAAEFNGFIAKMSRQWQEWRATVTPNIFADAAPRLAENLRKLGEKLQSNAHVKLSCCLPDGYGVEKCTVAVQIDGVWHEVGAGVYKASEVDIALFSRFIPVRFGADAIPEAIRITADGLGGIGLTHAEVRIGARRYVPEAVSAQTGRVENVINILDEDTKFAWLGGQSIRQDYYDANSAALRHSVTVKLKAFDGTRLNLPRSI